MLTSIGGELNKTHNTKNELAKALKDKGVSVLPSEPFSSYPLKIKQIIGGGIALPNTTIVDGKIGENVSEGDLLFYNGKGFQYADAYFSLTPNGYTYEIAFEEYNDVLYMAAAHAVTPFVTYYRLVGKTWEGKP